MCIIGYLLSVLNETNDREYYTKGPTGNSCGFWTENVELAAIFETEQKAIGILKGNDQAVKSLLRMAGQIKPDHPYSRVIIEIKPLSIGRAETYLSTFVMLDDGAINYSPIEQIRN